MFPLSTSQGLRAVQPCGEAPQSLQQFAAKPGFAVSASRRSCTFFSGGGPTKKKVSFPHTPILFINMHLYK